ncbi:carboxylesterase [Aspergillus sclerotioniger CBS 115572]|uniref:Carboxylic ester hydrolase n=1 Tax=Aspergillus sclerotioniger CBS 115572 TaxID=1450535 RepID=A0A317W9X1_9EURO|nr:carboxylesterase [Aspergillus sclerotioniger CBS 115572]PWY80860.1 carboxylesterase [Aspergillus sclerotioniger CBS 115572]
MSWTFHLAIFLGYYASCVNGSPWVDLGYSRYRGVRLPVGADEYLGMRYAAPPLGEKRFRAPEEPVKTSSIQDAFEFGPTCIGVGEEISPLVGEDCLFINVFTLSHASPHSKLPVWVHIQGGGYASNSNANFNGTKVVQQSGYDLVFVNFNYRVGALGFLASEEVRQDGNLNVGLLDQRQAQSWVQQHISKFGGDSDHVIVHGDSAGAGSVAHHMTAYGARDDGLFAAAILESPFWPTLRTVAEMEFQYARLVDRVGCSGAASALACLRSMNLTTLKKGNVVDSFPGAAQDPPPLWYFLPVIDGTIVRDQLSTLFDRGEMFKVPLLVGDDTNEGSTFAYNAANASDMSRFLSANYLGLSSPSMVTIHNACPRMRPVPDHAAYFPSASAAYGDAAFTCPGNHIAAAMANGSLPSRVWSYRYNVRSPELIEEGLGVPHIFELSAMFGVGFAGDSEIASYSGINPNVVTTVMNYWISFVKAMDPNPRRNSNAPYWDSWRPGSARRLKIQTNATGMEAIPQLQTDRCFMWKDLALEMEV